RRAAAPRAALQPHQLRAASPADRPHQPRRLMGRLVLIRHGESEGNRDRLFTHTPEVPLTDAGRAQVRAAAEWVAAARYRPVEVAARAGAALDRVAAGAPGNDVVVVSHGGVMMALWLHVTGEWRMGKVARNAGLVVVEHEAGRWRGATVIEEA